MTNKNRIRSILLVLSMLAAASVISCGSESNPADTAADTAPAVTAAVSEAETEAPPAYTDDMPDLDLDGYQFRILSELWTHDNTYGAHRMMYDDYTGNPVNDVLHESTLYIEERFNCDIVMIDGGDPYQMDKHCPWR